MSQVEMVNIMGGTIKIIEKLVALQNKISPTVIGIAKDIQKGRGGDNPPNGGFNFTEGWFRESGLYELNAGNQLEFMTWFVTAKAKDIKGTKPKEKEERHAVC